MMLWLALLFAIQAPPPAAEDDPLVAEVLDYRGRRDECENRDHDEIRWRLWRCAELGRDAQSLRAKLTPRPDLLARLDARVQDKDKMILISGSEWHSARIQRVVQDSTLRDSRKARVTVAANGDQLGVVTVDVAGRQPLVLTTGEPIDFPDLQSTRLSWLGEMLLVELNFGVEHPWCYVNQDGVSKLSLLIEGSRVRATRYDTVKCDFVARNVSVTRLRAQGSRP